ncbi:hypothetical protein FNL39_106160 [Nocardia caishijiensis]|uniref:Lipoprotein n=1 Tax=Nocardia caishijiensis TaxID=184756 RepID=A0ABQ6YJT0_9NOCA|nr:hypothetical protein FNL39_106160 [Nocardia caishijiensis]
MLAFSLVLTGCALVDEHGPTNEDIMRRSGLTVAKSTPIVADNFELIWPEGLSVDPAMVDTSTGCRSRMDSITMDGPPWRPSYQREQINPTQEFLDRAMANLEAMTARGFTLVPSQNPGQDPVSRYYRDARGFSVSSSRSRVGPDKQQVRFTMASTSPCAAE